MAKYTLIDFPSEDKFIKHAVADFKALSTEAIAQRNRFNVALSGGNTPKGLYEALANAEINWNKIHIYMGDERYVDVTHPDSNYGMFKRTLLSKIKIQEGNIHPIETHFLDPHESARQYEEELGNITLDLVYLGIGADGHTASLFPGSLIPTTQQVAAFFVAKLGNYRISLLPDLINTAREIRFLVSGTSKKPILDHILQEGEPAIKYPCQHIKGCEILAYGL
ncbi:MAG: 6-phosphogluconolactonase [Deltaproteobacteria bacterium]|nr:6-phosphogluconolactonase [Deltaproteobacteria bacterium]